MPYGRAFLLETSYFICSLKGGSRWSWYVLIDFLFGILFILAVKYTPQWRWLAEELKRVDRKKTPWLIVLMHVPIYNSNEAHFMEGESMRTVFESWFVKYKVDVVFAGHVHAYERSVCPLSLSLKYLLTRLLFSLHSFLEE